jgi:hypothetical protein
MQRVLVSNYPQAESECGVYKFRVKLATPDHIICLLNSVSFLFSEHSGPFFVSQSGQGDELINYPHSESKI